MKLIGDSIIIFLIFVIIGLAYILVLFERVGRKVKWWLFLALWCIYGPYKLSDFREWETSKKKRIGT